jgi:hypothetical protein
MNSNKKIVQTVINMLLMTLCFPIKAISATNVIDIKNIDYHLSIVMKNKHRFVQFIIIDKFEYNEDSVTLMNYLKLNELKRSLSGECLILFMFLDW